MPPLPDSQRPVAAALGVPRARPAHPSPTRDGLRLEAMSAKEIGWWGNRFGIDIPYLMVPTGWGEWEPLVSA
jgi:hypothetical protein